ncbi:MAG: hypothetical protein AAF721_20580 [Myxococcota bacterium]
MSDTTTPAMARLAVHRQAEARVLRDELLHHLWTEFPQHCIALTDSGCRRCVEAAIDAGQHYGLTELAPLRVFLTMMVMLGSDFHRDVQLPWAVQALKRNRALPQAQAMSRLAARTANELGTVAGEDGELYRRALLWVRSKRFDTLVTDYVTHGAEGQHLWLRALYVTKYDSLGRGRVDGVIEAARAAAADAGIQGPEGTMVFAGLMFLLGSGFAGDPFHPWVQPALQDARERPDTAASARAFYDAAQAELERYLTLDRVMRRG